MRDIDTWRRSEAEARQEMPKRTCVNCGAVMDDCDAWECPDCHDYYCHECKPELISVCFSCFERDDCFDEAEDPGYLEMLTGVSKEQLKASLDKITIRSEGMIRRLDEERGK
jgi:hypothetical protein